MHGRALKGTFTFKIRYSKVVFNKKSEKKKGKCTLFINMHNIHFIMHALLQPVIERCFRFCYNFVLFTIY